MKKKGIIPLAILISLVFNFGYALVYQNTGQSNPWPFWDLGPSIVQDSYFVRAPGLESFYGIFGDVPGGYPLYSGNPLQPYIPVDLTGSSNAVDWHLTTPTFDPNILSYDWSIYIIRHSGVVNSL